jgi:hypothetical protein
MKVAGKSRFTIAWEFSGGPKKSFLESWRNNLSMLASN